MFRDVIKAYVNDIMVKSAKTNNLMACLQKVFDVARQNRLKFNLKKFVFSTIDEKILCILIIQRCIEANLDKIQEILEIKSATVRRRSKG